MFELDVHDGAPSRGQPRSRCRPPPARRRSPPMPATRVRSVAPSVAPLGEDSAFGARRRRAPQTRGAASARRSARTRPIAAARAPARTRSLAIRRGEACRVRPLEHLRADRVLGVEVAPGGAVHRRHHRTRVQVEAGADDQRLAGRREAGGGDVVVERLHGVARPSGPTRRMRPPSTARIGSTRSMCSSCPPTSTARLPALAPSTPPETGASISGSARARRGRRQLSGADRVRRAHVDHDRARGERRAEAAVPLSSSTERTSAPVGSIVITASTPAKACGESPSAAAISRASCARREVESPSVGAKPAPARLRAIGAHVAEADEADARKSRS